ncbi:hypothetical protein N1851_027153 [Merluccius polli]|uniref:Uncharacterized protein n=1 Tax=Merluccius polli TaxID=89951 RepID=A0AA47MAH0_MERPO|nr:hypothetical protein N1851_027153 [Merluccius polli]
MTVHLFGASSSPSCACYALRKTAEDNQNSFPAEVIGTINSNFYMDDCLRSLPSEEEAVKLVKDLTAVCLKEDNGLATTVVYCCPFQKSRDQRFYMSWICIGISCQLREPLAFIDAFKFKMALKEQPHTKCGILLVVSSIYDPLGFLAPLTLSAKLILQDLCRRSIGWDDQIATTVTQWIKWLKNLERVTAFAMDRCLKPLDFGQPTHCQLHHFSDASEHGYGTVTYLRMQNNHNPTRKILSNCGFCRHHKGKLGEQKMSDLHVESLQIFHHSPMWGLITLDQSRSKEDVA